MSQQQSLRYSQDLVPMNPLLTQAYALQKARNYPAALFLLKQADFESAQLQNQLGRVLYLNQNPRAALQAFDKALEYSIAPSRQIARIRFNQALCHLALGEYRQGFKLYLEKALIGDDPAMQYPLPRWQGQNLQGKVILIHFTEGLGDSLQFLPLCEQLSSDAKIILLCPTALHPLLQTRFKCLSLDNSWPKADYYSPLYALPHYLNLSTQDLPLPSDFTPCFLNQPLHHLHKKKLSLGLVWRSQKGTASFQWRSLDLETIIQKLVVPHTEIHWKSLQFQPALKEQDLLKHYEIEDLGSEIQNFQDSLKQLNKIDLLISVDTALPHLAGLIHKPTWLLLPYEADWRWQLQEGLTPWYPRTRLFRQKAAGDWKKVWQAIHQKLQKMKQAPNLGPEEIS